MALNRSVFNAECHKKSTKLIVQHTLVCSYAKYHIFYIILTVLMLNAIILIVIMLSFIMLSVLNVIILSVIDAPYLT